MAAPTDPKTTAALDKLGEHDGIDLEQFQQIYFMDDDLEFGKGILLGFFDQAKETFQTMDEALEKKDLQNLSSMGHFLKGSSVTLGLVKVRDGCEKIQQYGKHQNLDGGALDDDDECLKLIEEARKAVEKDFNDIKTTLEEFIEELPQPPEEA